MDENQFDEPIKFRSRKQGLAKEANVTKEMPIFSIKGRPIVRGKPISMKGRPIIRGKPLSMGGMPVTRGKAVGME